MVTADNASALIELDGGQVVAELVTQGPLGDSVTPCASSASDSWYFADGVAFGSVAVTGPPITAVGIGVAVGTGVGRGVGVGTGVG